ncbi:hypothetical protein [Fastidiosibacter lacustris]|uniref:hypothetical protein n=1 Tax=Fastidiosibacter lacustris TaxID=2056695 RepID=UPI000E340978|nr:hypothetical protein [Fastidiosibacter lacustris]
MKKLTLAHLVFLITICILLLPLFVFLGICFVIYGLIAKKRIRDIFKRQQALKENSTFSENAQKGRVIDHE